MNNFNNYVDIDKVNSQLERAEVKKSKLIRNIYKEYELYLQIVRDIFSISVEKGLNELRSYRSIKDKFLDTNDFYCLFEEKISKLICKNLPLLTVEQLKINKIEKINKENNFNSSGSFTYEKFDRKQNSQYEEALHFKVSEDILNSSEYYQTENHEKFASLDLDKNDHSNYFSENNFNENIGLEKQFNSAILELMGEFQFETQSYIEKK